LWYASRVVGTAGQVSAPIADEAPALEGAPCRRIGYAPARERIHDYLQAAGQGKDADGPLLEALKESGGAGEDRLEPLTDGATYHCVLRKHAQAAGGGFRELRPARAAGHRGQLAPWTGAPTSRKLQEWLSARERVDHPALGSAPIPPGG
jgi:hypothetical protein